MSRFFYNILLILAFLVLTAKINATSNSTSINYLNGRSFIISTPINVIVKVDDKNFQTLLPKGALVKFRKTNQHTLSFSLEAPTYLLVQVHSHAFRRFSYGTIPNETLESIKTSQKDVSRTTSALIECIENNPYCTTLIPNVSSWTKEQQLNGIEWFIVLSAINQKYSNETKKINEDLLALLADRYTNYGSIVYTTSAHTQATWDLEGAYFDMWNKWAENASNRNRTRVATIARTHYLSFLIQYDKLTSGNSYLTSQTGISQNDIYNPQSGSSLCKRFARRLVSETRNSSVYLEGVGARQAWQHARQCDEYIPNTANAFQGVESGAFAFFPDPRGAVFHPLYGHIGVTVKIPYPQKQLFLLHTNGSHFLLHHLSESDAILKLPLTLREKIIPSYNIGGANRLALLDGFINADDSGSKNCGASFSRNAIGMIESNYEFNSDF